MSMADCNRVLTSIISEQRDNANANQYKLISIISSGSYGTVYKAVNKLTGEIVAVKQERRGLSKSTLREIYILKSLPSHPSLVQLKDVIIEDRDNVYVVMEYFEYDLKRFIDLKGSSIIIGQVKYLIKQLLEGVKFLHENGVMHRDLKPSNILINVQNDRLKICDFGLSRKSDSKSDLYTTRIGTRSYRAPEILLGQNNYSFAVDMWSVGCIMAELLIKDVLFKGISEIHQLSEINGMIGDSQNLLRRIYLSDTTLKQSPFLSELGFDLLSDLLAYDPSKRITVEEALRHGWFTEFDYYFYFNYKRVY